MNVKLRIPAVLNKFLQPIPVSAEEFFPQWRSLSGPPLKLQEVVCMLNVVYLRLVNSILITYNSIQYHFDNNFNEHVLHVSQLQQTDKIYISVRST